MKSTYITSILIAAVAWNGQLHAQETEQPAQTNTPIRHTLSAGAFGGIQTLTYQLTNRGVRSSGYSGGGGLGYAFHLTPLLSIATGIDLANYTASLEYNTLGNQTYRGAGARFNYNIGGYHEEQSALLLEIPIMIRLTVPVGHRQHAIRFAAGARFGWPANAQYTRSVKQHKTLTAFLDYENMEYNFDYIFPPNTPTAITGQTGAIQLKTALQIAAEIAYRIPLFAQSDLSICAFFSYGLNDMQDLSKQQLVTYSVADSDLNTSPPKYTYNGSILNTSFASSIRPLAIGIKLQLELGY
ncbi:MAG: hypothetical protein LBD91_05505 [Prevotellaceae bacterium]|jgi:hypothetical protein|nr:hypothetical protein [Prevotellaceae bacterium]